MDKIFEAGEYVITDLCYVITDDKWQQLCNDELDKEHFYIDINGNKIWWHFTAYGDGCFDFYYPYNHVEKLNPRNLRGIAVDAGLIGIVPKAFFENNEYAKVTFEEAVMSDYMLAIKFDKPFICDYTDKGTFEFGGVEVHTGDYGYEDEDDDY